MRLVGIAVCAVVCSPGLGADDPAAPPYPPAPQAIATPGGYNGVSRLNAPGRTAAYRGGYVGGGGPVFGFHRAEPRDGATDGTWGWDYAGFGRFPGRLFLGWRHDRPRQPAPGPYSPDGFHVPDPIAAHPFLRLLKGGGDHAAAGEGGEGRPAGGGH